MLPIGFFLLVISLAKDKQFSVKTMTKASETGLMKADHTTYHACCQEKQVGTANR